MRQYDFSKEVFISMSCKVYTHTIDLYGMFRGLEIFNFLMSDAGCTFDLNEEIISGDCNMWYFGCNEKFGAIEYGLNSNEETTHKLHWGFDESSFDNVEKLVKFLYDEGVISTDHFRILSNKIEEGRKIGDMYEIAKYLIEKKTLVK